MLIDNRDIAEFGARLLEYTVGGTAITTSEGTSLNANFPKLFHTDYGLRNINIALVFKPLNSEGGILAKMHSAALQKSMLDSLLYGNTVEIFLPDGYFYRCMLKAVGDESFDGERLELTYSFSGIRHLSMATVKGTKIYCSSTVATDCRITAEVTGCGDDTRIQFVLSHGTSSVSYSMNGVSSGDIIVFDGINCTVSQNGSNAFGASNVIEFPKLYPGKNTLIALHSSPIELEFKTEYYPTFI